jgi:hypothetical protein
VRLGQWVCPDCLRDLTRALHEPGCPSQPPPPLPATYPDALPPELERVAEAFTLAAQGRISTESLVWALWLNGTRWPNDSESARLVEPALAYLRRWESHYAPLIEGPCPQGMKCPEVGLCPWHRKILRQWFDRLHPVVRAAADPSRFAATVAPLLTDLPRSEA